MIGRNLDHRLLAATAELPEPALLDALRTAAEQQVLVTDAEALEYRFRHALVHEAVYDELLPGDRVLLHSRVATLLSEHPDWFDGPQGQLVSELACHWDAARDAARAMTSALEAARAAAAMYAYSEALTHTERALSMWSQVGDAEARTGMRHVDVMRYAAAQAEMGGSIDRALDFVQAAMREVDAETDPVTAGLLHDRWARYLWMLSRPRRYSRTLRACGCPRSRYAESGTGPGPRHVRSASDAVRANQEAIATCEAAIAVAQVVGERAIEGHARNSLGSVLAGIGRRDEGAEQLHLAREIALEMHVVG